MKTEAKPYLAYMLRLWQEHGQAELIWRASLESPHSGERHGFASLEALVEFLHERIRSGAQSAPPISGAESQERGGPA